ncbi:MAG: DUF4058 family protein [Planctomycetes bacterium]|nr:DUF4058 family protein [Planctomycetota bacterium]
MPLRDHFHPPIFNRHAWEGFHGGWPMTIVHRLFDQLPDGYLAEPRAHLGAFYEVDVASFEEDRDPAGGVGVVTDTTLQLATSHWTIPAPTATLDCDQTEPSEYEVLVYDENRARRLVAAIEIVSPSNKDRAEHRKAFVTKCAALLQSDVCVVIVDLVTFRTGNLYAELLQSLGLTDPTLGSQPPNIYAIGCRRRVRKHRLLWDTWAYPLELGRPLPTLPLWLTEELAVPLELEASYEETCRILHIS